MPTYEYVCTSCGHRVEAVQRFTDPPLTTCEECGGELKRVFHPVGIVLKGSGFYSTDNRSSKSLAPGKKDEAAPKTETKSSDTTSSPSKSGTAD